MPKRMGFSAFFTILLIAPSRKRILRNSLFGMALSSWLFVPEILNKYI